jgi:hypothetical protein
VPTPSDRDRPCDYLGNEDDRWTRTSIPWPGHRCYASGKPSEIARVQQGLFCLTANHRSCPTYVLARGREEAELPVAPMPPAPSPRRPWLPLGFLLRIGLIAAIVLLVIALDATVLRPFTTDSARSAAIVTPNPNVTTYTLFPPTRTPTPPASIPSAPPSPTATPPPPLASAPPPPAGDSQPRIAMQPGAGPRGSRVTLSGVNWEPNSELSVRYGPAASEEGMVELVRTRTGTTGSFTGSVLLPTTISGRVYVSVRQGDRAAYVPFLVQE